MKWVAALLPLLWAFNSFGQTNSWDWPFGGDWHDVSRWSAGVLPSTNQSILITNATTKTVRIGPDTAANYPETLRVETVAVSAPGAWRSTLLLDSTETNQFQTTRLEVGQGGELLVANSAASCGELLLKGSAAQWGSSYVYPNRLNIDPGGVYNLIEGMLRVGGHYVGSTSRWVAQGEDFHQEILPGVFNQYGGTNRVNDRLGVAGTYNLRGGRLQSHAAWRGVVYLGDGEFNQSGGVLEMPVLLGSTGTGRYNLSGGLRTGGVVMVWGYERRAAGHVVQTGGTNVGAIQLTPYIPSWGNGDGLDSSYTLRDGEIRSTTVTIGPFGRFVQDGGIHYNESLVLSNFVVCDKNQPGAPTECKTVYGTYGLSAGELHSSSIRLGGPFHQSGGSLVVGELTVGSYFNHAGGHLTVTTITLSGSFNDSGGAIHHRGRLNLLGGAWYAQAERQVLGPLVLGRAAAPTRATIFFPAERASVLDFASSSMHWPDSATLLIRNWNGSFGGGGTHQLRFGTNANGLTAAQLQRIIFENPNGIQGVHPARILDDGEVVPVPTTMIAEKRGAQLLLHSPPGFALQTSTNINGPFEDLPATLTASPLQLTDPMRFFRIRPEQ